MSSQRHTQGQALAAVGGAGLAASLWLPWYSVQISQAAVNSITQSAQQLGALAPLVRTGAQLLNQLGPFHVTAWQVFKTTPAVLLVVAVIAGGLAVLALTDRAGNTSQITMLAGALGAVLVGYRIAVPPGQGSFVHPAWGIYLALVSTLLMLAGGGLSASDSGDAVPAMTLPNPAGYAPGGQTTGWPPATATTASTPYTTSPEQSGAATGWFDPPARAAALAGSDPPAQASPAASSSASQSVPPPAP